jgi:hypothetical protein
MEGLCIYKYQLATQVDRGQVHLSQKSDRVLARPIASVL